MTSAVLRFLRVDSVAELVAAALMLLSYPVLMTAALIPHFALFAAVCAVSYLADNYLHHRGSYLLNRLTKVRAGLSLRFLVRQLLLVLLLSRMDLAEDPISFTAIAAFILFYGLQAPHTALTTLIRTRRRLPVITRNVDLAEMRIADAPAQWLTSRAAEKMQHLDLAAVVGVLVAARTGATGWGFAGMAVSLGLAVVYTVVLALFLRKGKLPPKTDEALEWFDGWLRSYRPTTVLYFSGSVESTYQVNMWLETMRELDGRPLVILRERHTFADLGSTAVPVACVPSAVHLMGMDLSSVQVALYPANVGKNIHLLRVPTIQHVFIGHGDSDKIASVNPYSKVYDEVWTAGKAGRDRYALANVGVRDESIVEVGRPQLAPILPARSLRPSDIPTVLYAPTWEGWTDEPGNTSLLLAGENIVRRLVEAERPVRVLYKPHPFTGTRSPEAKAAHQRIVALLDRAAQERAGDPYWAAEAERNKEGAEAARRELVRIDTRMEQLRSGGGEGGDEAQVAREALADPVREAELKQLRSDWNDAYWRTFGRWEHKVVTGLRPQLYDCFNESDGMVSDISSVVSDFIASGKPYAVTDSAGLGVREFKRQNTAVRAAVILSNSAGEIGVLLDAINDPSADSMAEDRSKLKSYLLGPDEPASIVRFDRARRALAATGASRNAEQLVRLGEGGTPTIAQDSAAGPAHQQMTWATSETEGTTP